MGENWRVTAAYRWEMGKQLPRFGECMPVERMPRARGYLLWLAANCFAATEAKTSPSSARRSTCYLHKAP